MLEYIDQQYETYMSAERHPGFRTTIPDTRVHAVLYFLAPTGHGLKELDIKALKTLSQKVNVIPLIAKGDTMTPEEKIAFKNILLRDFEEYQIKTFPSSYPDHVDGAEELFKHIPFTVLGSDNFQVIGGKKVRARAYRWGVVEVENAEHSDFVYLRELLLVTCLHDLVESTHDVHYHGYRAKALRAKGRPTSLLECDETYDSHLENSKQAKDNMERKEEEIRQKFIEKVHETEAALREREEQLMARKAEMVAELEQYKALLEAQQREVDELEANSRNNTLSKNSSKTFRSK
ncbi:Septin 4 [Entomortierella lignicola]|nr:Septin 4 [Entomortierella lignicola]